MAHGILSGSLAPLLKTSVGTISVTEDTSALYPSRYNVVHFDRTEYVASVKRGIEEGSIDQKHYYLTPDAAAAWHGLISSADYNIYSECKESLRSITESDIFQRNIFERNIRSVHMLAGGGSPTKDDILLRAMMRSPHVKAGGLSYRLVDISYYMLRTTRNVLDTTLSNIPDSESINITLLCKDILKFRDYNEFRDGPGPALFCITGGTIGNLSERDFFLSVDKVSSPNDLLIVGADTLTDRGSPASDLELLKSYDNKEIRNLLSPAISSLAGELDYRPSEVRAAMRVVLDKDGSQRSSDVDGSVSVRIYAKMGDRIINLGVSTRYIPERLIQFAASYGWKLLLQVPGPRPNSTFVQFLFSRN